MEKTRVLLTVEQQFYSQLLKQVLAACPDLEVVGEVTEVVQCLMMIADKQPHVWIHSWEEGDDLAAMQSHIYSFHPSISIIRVNPNEPAGYIQMQVNSLPELLELATRSRQWAGAA